MTVTHRDVIAWADPWPIIWRTPPRGWSVRFLTLKQCLRFRAFWQNGRYTAKTAAQKVRKGWLGRDHYVESLMRLRAPLYRPVILVQRGVIVDGNHTLLALERRKYRGRILVLQVDDLRRCRRRACRICKGALDKNGRCLYRSNHG